MPVSMVMGVADAFQGRVKDSFSEEKEEDTEQSDKSFPHRLQVFRLSASIVMAMVIVVVGQVFSYGLKKANTNTYDLEKIQGLS
nr:hypothetical protein BaRGS_011772 [Batillaria attramentaria]